jgi:hypothetical protein
MASVSTAGFLPAQAEIARPDLSRRESSFSVADHFTLHGAAVHAR